MKSKVGIIISNLSGGGAQRVVSTLSGSLAQYYDLYLILHNGSFINYTFKGKIIDLKTPVRKSSLMKMYYFLVRIIRLRLIKKRLKFSTVISFLESSNIINILSGSKGKTIISVRNFKSKQSQGLLAQLFNVFIKHKYNKSDVIVCVSEGVKDDLISNYGLKRKTIKVIYNPYDIDFIEKSMTDSIEKDYHKVFDKPVLVTVGKMMRQKGQWHLIRSFSVIKQYIPEMKLVIIGDGELKHYLRDTINNHGLSGEVILTGYQENPFKFIKRSSIFILPSLYEGFPNALVEAMVCGIPVISADCRSGPREILAPDTNFMNQAIKVEYREYGVLIPVCDGNMYRGINDISNEELIMAESVVSLFNDTEIYNKYVVKIKQRVNDFSLSNITKEWVNLIES